MDAIRGIVRIKEATVIVSDNRIEATIMIGNKSMADVVRHIVYEGPTTITDIDIPRIGNIDADVNVEMSVNTAPYCYTQNVFYPQSISTGKNMHQMMIIEDIQTGSGHYFLLYLINSNDNPFGTYTPLGETSGAVEYTFIPGALDGNNNITGSWYTTLTNGQLTYVDAMAPLQKGTITVAQDGERCIVTIDCYDEAGHHITANINTPFQQIDEDQYGVPAAIMRMPTTLINQK